MKQNLVWSSALTRNVLALAATICLASMSHAQSRQPKPVTVILPDVALLIHAPVGEYSYKLTSTADDSVTLEEFGDRRTRLEIRQNPDKKCVFISTSQERDGFDIVELDFTKFDGTYQLWEACRGCPNHPGRASRSIPDNRTRGYVDFAVQSSRSRCSSRSDEDGRGGLPSRARATQ
jgi:hypothetical protein